MNSDEKAELIKKRIYELLGKNNGMTELNIIGILHSFPDIMLHDNELDLVTNALNALNEAGLLKLSFRTDKRNYCVQTIIEVSARN